MHGGARGMGVNNVVSYVDTIHSTRGNKNHCSCAARKEANVTKRSPQKMSPNLEPLRHTMAENCSRQRSQCFHREDVDVLPLPDKKQPRKASLAMRQEKRHAQRFIMPKLLHKRCDQVVSMGL